MDLRETQCPICMEAMASQGPRHIVTIIKCGHCFCATCMGTLLAHAMKLEYNLDVEDDLVIILCPLCKGMFLISHIGRVFLDVDTLHEKYAQMVAANGQAKQDLTDQRRHSF